MKHFLLALAAVTLVGNARAAEYKVDTATLVPKMTLVGTASVKTMEELAAKYEEIFKKVGEQLHQSATEPTGAPFSRFLRYEPGTIIEVELGFPVAAELALALDSGLKMSELPGGLAATTLHVGPYDTIGGAYDAIVKWVEDNKMEITGAPWEVYLNDPSTVTEAEIQTQIYFPIK